MVWCSDFNRVDGFLFSHELCLKPLLRLQLRITYKCIISKKIKAMRLRSKIELILKTKIMKKLKCILKVPNTTHVVTDVTVGEIYEQDDIYDDCDDYYIKDNTGKKRYYDHKFFEVI